MATCGSNDRLRSLLREVIHAINSPIGVVLGTTQFVSEGIRGKRLEELTAEDLQEIQEAMAVIERQGRRCADLVHGMRDLVHAGQLELKPTDIQACLLAALEEIAWAEAGIEVRKDVEADLPSIMGDPERLREAFLAIERRAFQATSAGGRFGLAARKTETGLEVCFEDNGVGLAPEQRSKLFSPFHSTGPGEGQGWALAAASLILEAHGAELKVEGEPGQGTRVIVRFPVADHSVSRPRHRKA
jgi:signal transduction histidine kinase